MLRWAVPSVVASADHVQRGRSGILGKASQPGTRSRAWLARGAGDYHCPAPRLLFGLTSPPL